MVKAVKNQTPVVDFAPTTGYTKFVDKVVEAILADKLGYDVNFTDLFFDSEVEI